MNDKPPEMDHFALECISECEIKDRDTNDARSVPVTTRKRLLELSTKEATKDAKKNENGTLKSKKEADANKQQESKNKKW